MVVVCYLIGTGGCGVDGWLAMHDWNAVVLVALHLAQLLHHMLPIVGYK
jgi:hypothetical protein